MGKLRVLDLFSGIGGFSLGLERTGGFETVAFCEIEDFPRRVLAKHWPNVPCYRDVRELNADTLARDGIAIDAISAGFPCQDLSVAGLGQGLDGARSGLWTEVARILGDLREAGQPARFAVLENVSALLGRGLDRVLRDLAALGYDAEWHCIPASALGFPHRRDRIWIIAYANKNGLQERMYVAGVGEKAANGEQVGCEANRISSPSGLANSYAGELALGSQAGRVGRFIQSIPRYGARAITSEPVLGRGADGLPNRVDRCGALGNAVVPQIPELIGRAILERMAA